MGRPSKYLRVGYLASTATLLLFLGHRAVYAQTGADASAATPALTGGLDRILVALGILLVLAQATERVVVILRKLLPRIGLDWAGPSAEEAPPGSREKADRSLVINAFLAVPAGLFVAVICGVDVIYLAVTGDVALIWHFQQWDRLEWIQHLFGLLLTGLIASMGSAFLHDLIAIVTAAKDARRKAVAAPSTTFPIPPPPTEDPRKLLDDDHPSIYDIDRESLGLPLNELGIRAADVAAQLRSQGIEGIVGVGPAYKQRGGRRTRIRGFTVSVIEKHGSPQREIPRFLSVGHEGRKVLVPIDVQQVGRFELTADLRPGSQITGERSGTLCCFLAGTDRQTGQSASPLLLGCRHVLGKKDTPVRLGGEIGEVTRCCEAYDTSLARLDSDLSVASNTSFTGITPVGSLGLMPSRLEEPLYTNVFTQHRGQEYYSHKDGYLYQIVSSFCVPALPGMEHDLVPPSAVLARLEVQSGDSGALAVIYDDDGPQAVGMLVAASADEGLGLFVQLEAIFTLLDVGLLSNRR